MLLTVYDSKGQEKTVLSADDSSTQVKELQSDNILTLSFTLYEHVALAVNDYVLFRGERFWVTERYQPTEKSSVEWSYDLKLYGIESLIKRFLVLKDVDGEDDPVFTLTATPYEHVSLIVRAINEGMGTSDWKVGEVTGTDNIVVDYQGTYCNEALAKIAKLVGTEWWVEGQTVNLCRCEHGETVVLGYDKGLTGLERDTASNVKFYTRLFPIGSSRNIDATKYGYSRLQLPGGVKYVDVNTDKYGIIHHYEADAFAGIYPRRVGTVSDVRAEEVTDEDGTAYTIHYFKDNSLDFDPNSYELTGKKKRVSFQEGSELSGLGNEEDGTYYFEADYHSDTREFEIVTIWPYDDGTQLPGGTLVPKPGDRYILWNIRMPDEYIRAAETEYRAAVDAYNARHGIDVSVYKSSTDYVYIEENQVQLYIGRRVRLESREYFPETGYRDSRITKITRKVNNPAEMEIEISDAVSTGIMDKIEDNIASAVKSQTVSAASSFHLPGIIGCGDNTLPTDKNVYSARRVNRDFLSKTKPDTAHKHITFEEGITVHQLARMMNLEVEELATIAQAVVQVLRSGKFVDGFAGEGYQIWQQIASGDWNFTIDNITVRKCMTIYELIVQKIRSVGGMVVVSAANGKVKEVTLENGSYRFVFEDENGFQPHDLMRCQVFTGRDVRYYWVEVAAVEGDAVVVPESEFAGVVPAAGDECVLMGNTENAARQNLILISATEDGQPRIDVLDGVHEKNFNGCLRTRLGALDGISDSAFPVDAQPSGYGLYSNNCFLTGIFVLANGKDVLTMFSIMEGMIKSEMASVRYDMNVKDNYLNNTVFAGSLDGWTLGQGIRLFKVGGRLLAFNRNFYANKASSANIATQDGRYVLRIKNSSVTQKNADLARHPEFELVDQIVVNEDGSESVIGKLYRPKMFYVSFKYLVKEPGTLRVLFQNEQGTGFEEYSRIDCTKELQASTEFLTMEIAGKWDGTGDFYLAFTGDIYIYQLFLAGNPLSDFAETYKSHMEVTDKKLDVMYTHIRKNDADIEKYYSEIQLTAEQLRLSVTKEVNDVKTAIGQLELRADQFSTAIGNNSDAISAAQALANKALGCGMYSQEQYSQTTDPWSSWASGTEYKHVGALWYNPSTGVTKRYVGTDNSDTWETVSDSAVSAASYVLQNKDKWSLVVGNFDSSGNPTAASGIVTTATGNSLWVQKGGVISSINQSAESVSINASKINFNGAITANGSFKIDTSGTFSATAGKVGGFTIQSGRLYWKGYDYFGSDSRSLKLGVSSTDTEGIVDVAFNAATSGRFGVKSVGSNLGGAAIYGSTGTLTYPGMSMTYAGYFVGPVDVRDTSTGLVSDVCASLKFRAISSRNSNGTYNYYDGISFGAEYDLDDVRLVVRNGIIVGLRKDNGSIILGV